MSLDEKNINPLAPAEPPAQNPDLLPKPGKKRRKSEGSSSRKAKKVEDDEDGSVDTTAVLTMAEAPRKQKKMLFEPDLDGGPVSLMPQIARKDNGSTRAALAGTAAAMPVSVPSPVVPPAPAPEAAAPVSEPTPVPLVPAPKAATPAPEPDAVPAQTAASAEPQPTAAAEPVEPKPQPIADMKGAVFQVATLVMREPEPAPTEPSQSAPEPVDAGAEQPVIQATETVASDATEATTEESSDSQGELPLSGEETASLAESADDNAMAPSTVVSMADDPGPVAQPAAVAGPQPAPTPAPAAAETQPTTPQPVAEPEVPARLSRSEMIARAARMSALSSSRANGSAVPAPPAPRPATPPPPPQQRPAELPKHAGDLYGYWTRVKNGRRFPSRADFDVEQMAENFPNSMLLTCGANGGSQVNFSSILRLGANRRSLPGESLNFTSMITEWILAIGGEAVRAGTPVQDTEVFPSPDGTFAYKIVALPLSDQQTRVEHVLCHLSRS
jgi:hypothetical protein